MSSYGAGSTDDTLPQLINSCTSNTIAQIYFALINEFYFLLLDTFNFAAYHAGSTDGDTLFSRFKPRAKHFKCHVNDLFDFFLKT